jgi:hypothetical protein
MEPRLQRQVVRVVLARLGRKVVTGVLAEPAVVAAAAAEEEEEGGVEGAAAALVEAPVGLR